jgi:hypothetical protein
VWEWWECVRKCAEVCAGKERHNEEDPVGECGVVYGVVCGVWCVVCGVWCVVCGVWCVVCGVVCGRKCVNVLCGEWRCVVMRRRE